MNTYSQVWQQTTLDSEYVKCMLVNPVNNNLFVGTLYSQGVYLSTDYGNTWLIRNNGLTSTSIYGLAIDTTGTLFAATWGGGMFRSTNNGLNWVQINNGITNSVLFSVAVNHLNNYVFAGSGGSGIYRSTDNGNSWTLVNNGLTSFSILALAVTTNGYIFAGTYDGVFRSTDNGDNWTTTDITSGWGEGFATTNPVYNIFAGVHTVGVYRSSDFGNSFQVANNGLSQTSVFAIATTPFNYVYAGIFGGGGVYRSTDNGDSWSELNDGLTNGDVRAFAITNNGYVFVGTFGSGVFRSDQPIPVELTAFSANVTGASVQLSWSTATEVNNLGFEIQRSLIDKNNSGQWTKIAFVPGHGNSTEIQNYSYVDNNIAPGNYNYRLKIVDLDGTYQYSSIVNSVVTAPAEYSLEQNFPNPFNPSTRIKFNIAKDGFVTLKVYDVLGNEVATLVNENRPAGVYEVEFNTSKDLNLSSGLYIYRLSSGEFVQTRKMLLLQ